MKYKCGPIIYDLPETACVFCQNANVYWDFSGGMYLILCPVKTIKGRIWLKGCENRKPFPEGTEFVSKEEIKMFNCGIDRVITELSNQIIMQEEDTLVKVIQEAGYKVDKKQLTKALTDARAYYKDGYNDGYYNGRLDAAREMSNILIKDSNFDPESSKNEDC